ncbi:MAG: ATP-binding protein [Alphaproteobacteria bacterium]|nr:ATP-binding protein [Alphaproteobacteria bacterium]
MFSYLRYFSLISFIIVVLAAVLLGVYFRSIATSDLADVAEKSSISLAQGYINTTWKEHLPSIRQLSALDTAKWKRYKEFVKFSEDTFRHFEGVPITQLSIYTPGGERVLSVNQHAEIRYNTDSSINALPQDDETRLGFGQAKVGNFYSRIIDNNEFKTPAGQTVKGAVVQTFVPIMPDSYSSVLAGADMQIEGVIEVFYDITPQWEQLYLFQMVGTGGILIIFITLLGALYFTSKKAESIITTQHEANVELAATAAKAEAESRQKSQFLANVSHELRTPLNAIIGFSEIIKNEVMGKLENQTYMNYIKDIHSSGVHLLSLINDILDFSKAEAGKLELHLAELDATKLIKNCMRLVSPRAEQANVSLVTEVPKEHFVITGDAKKLKQVLLNLLSNAVKFTPENGEVKITAWQNVMDDSIAIEVKDSGIGIAPKDISRAMSPFGQVDSALSRKYEGTGLGLPLTKKFVEIMGGTFRIESELNSGTTITITIPLTPPRHVLKAAAKAQAEEATNPREKQISPQLMDNQEPPEPDMPVNPLAGRGAAKPAKLSHSLLAAQDGVEDPMQPSAPPPLAPQPEDMPPTPSMPEALPITPNDAPMQPIAASDTPPEEKIMLVRPQTTSSPAPSTPSQDTLSEPLAVEDPEAAPVVSEPIQPLMPEPLQPARSLTAGKTLPTPASTPEDAVEVVASNISQEQANVPHEASDAEQNTAERPAPAQSDNSGQKFMSYADLKRMAEKK